MRRCTLIVLVSLTLSSAAQAQEYVRVDCQATASSVGLQFETPVQRRWYKRFWNGECDRLSFCISGAPNWNGIVEKLLARGGASHRVMILPMACRLGQLIGLEWSRDRKVRRITTADLRSFSATLESTKDTVSGLSFVEAAARRKMRK